MANKSSKPLPRSVLANEFVYVLVTYLYEIKEDRKKVLPQDKVLFFSDVSLNLELDGLGSPFIGSLYLYSEANNIISVHCSCTSLSSHILCGPREEECKVGYSEIIYEQGL